MKRQKFDEYQQLRSTLNDMETRTSWEPTEEDIKTWGEKVKSLTALAEKISKEESLTYLNQKDVQPISKKQRTSRNKNNEVLPKAISIGHDRTGKIALSYQDSLPPFIKFASDGNVAELKKIISSLKECEDDDENKIAELIMLKDRNGSTAESWAAGGGYTKCLTYILQLKKQYLSNENHVQRLGDHVHMKKMRRRDGKTPLHYAARNGHIECMKILLDESCVDIDEKSGDGTTPLHMACYGGKFKSIQFLVKNGANANLTNTWGCNSSHWIAMSINLDHEEVINACNFLYNECDIPFDIIQKQGHSCLHKAAQRKNIHIIQWMAKTLEIKEKQAIGKQDDGGNRPSDILESVGGDPTIVKWMRDSQSW